MKTLKLTLIGIAFLVFKTNGFSQSPGFSFGYVVTIEGDTLRGELKYKNKYTYTQRVILRDENGEKKTFNFKSAKFFSANDEYYELHEVKGETDKMFLRRFIHGPISYYEYHYELMQMNKIVVKTESYVKAADSEELVKINGGNFKKVLSEMMSSQPTIVDRINAKDTKFEDVKSIVASFNALKK